MIRPEALTRLRLLVGAVRTPLVASNPDAELPPLQPGQPIDGRVEQQSRAGYVVSVRGRNYDFKLPDGTRPGDLLRLVYVNDNPRPTFSLLRIERAIDQGESQLSDAGKLLAVLREIQVDAPEEPATRATVPVFQAQGPETPKAASILRDTLALSGLFYESHQAQWVLGTRSTAQLQREPQGRLAPMQPAAPEMMELQETPAIAEGMQALPAISAVPARSPEAHSPPQPGPTARSPAHPDSFSIIRQQLNALESGYVAWRGFVWPGQPMQWQVGDGASGEQEHGEGPRTWRTELKVTLPNIGELLARIELRGNGAKVRIVADSERHARKLREHGPALVSRFSASGIPVHALEVDHGPEKA